MGQVTLIISDHYRALNARHFLPHKWPENRRPPQIKLDLRRMKTISSAPNIKCCPIPAPFISWLSNDSHDDEDNK
jgi:hypothetical protein